MNKLKLILIMLIMNISILFSLPLPDDLLTDDELNVISNAIDGIINISASIISDTFVPMTHSSKGDLHISIVPAYCDVDVVSKKNDWKGKDLKVLAFGAGAGYSITDSLIAYGIAAGMNINGTVYTDGYSGDTEYNLTGIYTGLGYDLIKDNSKLSIPVFAGFYIQNYDTTVNLTIDAVSDAIDTYDTDTYLAGTIDNEKVTTEGSGTLYGYTFATAVSYKFLKNKRITPYFLYCKNLNKAKIDTTISATGTIGFVTEPLSSPAVSTEINELEASMLGLTMAYSPSKKLDFSFSISGLLNSKSGFYNDEFLDGLKLTTIAMAVTYKN